MGKINGPLIYDSLDKTNSGDTKPQQQIKSESYNQTFIVLILVIAVLLVLVVVYVLYWLNSMLLYSTLASVVLWVFIIGVVLSVIAALFNGVFYLYVTTLRKSLVSLNDGMHIGVFSVLSARYDTAFDSLAARYFDMWETRMRNSQYSGVSTLTLDQSVQSETSTTSVKTESDNDTNPPELPLGKDKSILEDLNDKGIINRSGNSLFVGFSRKE